MSEATTKGGIANEGTFPQFQLPICLRECDGIIQDDLHWFLCHSMLNLTWMPIKVLRANSMLVGIKKSWGIFPIKQKSNTMTAFVDSENC